MNGKGHEKLGVVCVIPHGASCTFARHDDGPRGCSTLFKDRKQPLFLEVGFIALKFSFFTRGTGNLEALELVVLTNIVDDLALDGMVVGIQVLTIPIHRNLELQES